MGVANFLKQMAQLFKNPFQFMFKKIQKFYINDFFLLNEIFSTTAFIISFVFIFEFINWRCLIVNYCLTCMA